MQSIICTILGRSGTGKSASIRNLNPETTVIISTDAKRLPFKGAEKFNVVSISGKEPDKMFALLSALKTNKKFNVVVIDALTQFGETLMFESNRRFRGFDRQNNYNDKIFEFFEMLKDLEDKVVFIFSHPVIGETFEGSDTIVGKIDNKQRKGIIEERSTILFMARTIKEGNGIRYVFETKSNGNTPSKAPIGMFEEDVIDNDLNIVVDKINEYYK